MPAPTLHLGKALPLSRVALPTPYRMPAHHLVTHGVVLGMTGSGKTGLVTVIVEEALRAGVPVIAIDVKGDLPNLLFAFPSFDASAIAPYVDAAASATDDRAPEVLAVELAEARAKGLASAGIDEAALRAFHDATHVRIVTPGSTAGEPLHVLSALERRSSRWDTDREAARTALVAAVSLVLRLVGREADPAKSREHVLLSVLAERRLVAGEDASLTTLLADLADPPIEDVGALPLDAFMAKNDRKALAAALNALLVSPAFAGFREGASLDAGAWLAPTQDGRTTATILSVAHLDDEERALVLGVVLEEVLAHVRTLPGSQRLRALVVFDEVYGYLPPHPANPPTKRPLVALMKQARAFGVGVIVATQNPMDLDYRALGNAGAWCIGRLQTDADRARVVEGLAGAGGLGAKETETPQALSAMLKKLKQRWFLVRDAHADDGLVLMQPRWAMSWLRGPMTRGELLRARGERAQVAPLSDARPEAS